MPKEKFMRTRLHPLLNRPRLLYFLQEFLSRHLFLVEHSIVQTNTTIKHPGDGEVRYRGVDFPEV